MLTFYDKFVEEINGHELKRFAQFANMTDIELYTLMTKINRIEYQQWLQQFKDQQKAEREADKVYIEEHMNKYVLPSEPVQITGGVMITPNIIDDRGFISHDDLSHQKGTFKLSLMGTDKKIYLT
jgi:hypothetical protein